MQEREEIIAVGTPGDDRSLDVPDADDAEEFVYARDLLGALVNTCCHSSLAQLSPHSAQTT